MKPIFLMGLMGSGKTYWGRKLAKHLGIEFIDLDFLIEEKEGKTISEIFEQDGELRFRDLETFYLNSLMTKKDVVIALGGGTPCFNDNITSINVSGNSYYLKVDLDVIVNRLAVEKSTRPLIKNKNKHELKAFFEKQLKEREPFYRHAKHIVEVGKFNEPGLLEYLCQKINQDK